MLNWQRYSTSWQAPDSIAARPRIEVEMWMKMALDRVLALAALLVLAPLLLLCAVGIMCVSPGPVLFSQMRVGYQGLPFRIFKFRTMHASNSLAGDEMARMFWLGRLLRHLSIDELPQLLNVLRGEMSLVGPRPHMVGQRVEGQLFEEAVLQYSRRHQVMPGMTGLAQISGCRGPAVTRAQIARRVALDLQYVDRWSLKLDLLIIARTICFGFLGAPVS